MQNAQSRETSNPTQESHPTVSSADGQEAHSDGSDDSDNGEHHPGAAAAIAKKVRSSRACIACRKMKTRCEIDEALGNACKLCIRARRQCIMQSTPRRRKRKTTERVAELERKIDALTSLLASTESPGSGDPSPKSTDEASPNQARVPESSEYPEPTSFLINRAMASGILSWDTAIKAFNRWQTSMAVYFPFVVFPENTSPREVKENQPLLFFAIVTAALNTMRSEVESDLGDMLTKDLADRIVYRGERSLELVQALVVHMSWYTRAKHMRELNFNQVVHIACTMALDIGLGRRSHRGNVAEGTDMHQLESLAGRRAWLGCYYTSTSVAIALRHPTLVRWSVYIEECLAVIESAPHALPSDPWLCDLIRLQHIAEDASAVFSMDDPGNVITLRDSQAQYQMRVFRQQLERWRSSAKVDVSLPYVRHIEANATLFIHEIALHSEHNIDELRSPVRQVPGGPRVDETTSSLGDLQFGPARVEALFICLGAIHASFDAILAMDFETLCTLPNLYLVRTGYAARALRKLLNIYETQSRVGAQVNFNVHDLKFEMYMDLLIDVLARTYAENNSQIARAFRMVMVQIKGQGLRSLQAAPAMNAELGLAGANETPMVTESTPVPAPPAPGAFALRYDPFDAGPVKTSAPEVPVTADIDFSLPSGPFVTQPPPQQGAPSDALSSQAPLPPWIQGDSIDAFMTGHEAQEWFNQEFVLDDFGMYEF